MHNDHKITQSKGSNMKTAIIILITTLATFASAQSQTTRCVKNWDGSVTCTTRSGGGF